MGTIYVDKHTALETMNSSLRIRHHSEYMQIQTTLEREDIRALVPFKAQYSTDASVPGVIMIETVVHEVVLIPVWSEDEMSVMLQALDDFWSVVERHV